MSGSQRGSRKVTAARSRCSVGVRPLLRKRSPALVQNAPTCVGTEGRLRKGQKANREPGRPRATGTLCHIGVARSPSWRGFALGNPDGELWGPACSVSPISPRPYSRGAPAEWPVVGSGLGMACLKGLRAPGFVVANAFGPYVSGLGKIRWKIGRR